MELTIQILAIACLVILIINHDLWQRVEWKSKPFACALCMGWWLSVVPLTLLHMWWGPVYAALTAVLVEFIDRKLNNF
jgi:hypothetical protein